VVQASTLKILAGHGVVEAAKQAGETTIAATVVDCTDEEALAILVDDNELARHAEDDREELATLLADLHETEFAPLAYNDAEIEDLLRELTMPRMGEAEEDEPPEPQAEAVSQTGDLWICGEHRVLCGDSTKAADIARALDGKSVGCLVFDPPYNDAKLMALRFSEVDAVLAFADGRRAAAVSGGWEALVPRWLFVWDCVVSWYVRGLPLARGKCCVWMAEAGAAYDPDGSHYGDPDGESRVVSNTRGSYVYTPDPRGKHLADVFVRKLTQEHAEGSSHSKPLDWVRMLVGNCTAGVVFDPFLGSGTSLTAAEQLGRACVGIEIDPRQVDVGLRRWMALTGQAPIHAETGEAFKEKA
jgi:hypothetical protein